MVYLVAISLESKFGNIFFIEKTNYLKNLFSAVFVFWGQTMFWNFTVWETFLAFDQTVNLEPMILESKFRDY